MRKSKPINNLTEVGSQNLSELSEQGRALPDLVRKKHIYESHKIMLDFAGGLSNRMNRNSGVCADTDIYNLMSSMYVCWHLVNMMVYENKIFNLYNSKTYVDDDFKIISNIWKHHNFINNDDRLRFIRKLFHLIDYIDFCLHRLNLTNLIMDNIGFDSDEATF